MPVVESPAGSAGVWLAARLIASLFYRVQRTGPPIPGGAVLLVANHPNALLDPALVQTTAGRPVRFLAKSTLFRGHVLGPIIRCFRHQVLLRRDRHWDDSGSCRPVRVGEHQHVARRRNRSPRGREDVPDGQPPRGESRLHRWSPRRVP